MERRAAAVSVGNVTKVKQLVGTAHPELLEALRGGEVSIHWAWKWSTESPDQQIEALRTYRNKKGLTRPYGISSRGTDQETCRPHQT